MAPDIVGLKPSRQALLIVLSSLWVPLVWVGVVIGFGELTFGEVLFDSKFRHGFVHLWLLATWGGSIPLTASIWFLGRRVGAWAIPVCTVSVLLSQTVLFVETILIFALVCFGCRPPSEWQLQQASFWVGGFIAACSLPVWIHLGIVALAQRRRTQRRAG